MGVSISDHVHGCGIEISFNYLFGVACNDIHNGHCDDWEVGMGRCSVKEVLLNGETQYR